MKNWKEVDYLLNGTATQKRAYYAIQSSEIMEKLKEFNPILVGTFPLNLDIETSDLDIICHYSM